MPAPDTISGLSLWLRADALSLANNAAVATWPDSGPGGFDATQATSTKRPTYRTGQINGLPAVRFDGGDGLVSGASASHPETTLFVVVRPESLTGDRTFRSGSSGGALIYRFRNSAPNFGRQTIDELGGATTAGTVNAWNLVSASFSDAANEIRFYRAGSADGVTATTAALTAGLTTFIGEEPGQSRFLLGDIAELIVYSRVLTAAERATVHSYLQDKYGIAVADYVPSTPTADAGADATVPVALPFTRTATENNNGSTITSRAWTIVSGPAGVGSTIGTAAALSWTPTVSGSYVLRYSVTNANGTGSDDVAVSVLPSYVRDFRVAQSNTTTVTVPHPAGTQEGDLMVAFCINDFIAATATGWTRDSAAGSSASDIALNIFRRAATATETDHVFDVGASTSATIAVVAFNKLEVADTWDVAPELANLSTTASTTTPASPSITTLTAKALLLTVYGTAETGSGHGLHTPPTGMTELIDYVPSGTGRGLHVAAATIDPAAATGTRTATTAGTAKIYVAQAMAASPRTVQQIAPTGIPSAETFGATVVAAGTVTVAPTGIESAEAVGTAQLNLTVAPVGIASQEAFGAATVAVGGFVLPTGIASAEAFGSPTVTTGPVTVAPAGIPSGEAVGTPNVVAVISPAAIPSAEAFGAPSVMAGAVVVAAVSIGSAEEFGTATFLAGAVTVTATGIPSAEAVGTPSLSIRMYLTGIASDAAVGTPTLTVGPVTVAVFGIESGEAFGSVEVGVTFNPELRNPPARPKNVVTYELILVARVPQPSGPPAFIDVDRVVSKTLSWSSTLSRPQGLTATCPISSITEAVKQRLRDPLRHPCELRLLRDGDPVFTGPLMTGRRNGEDVVLEARGLLAYTAFMFVEADLRFDQVDQFVIAATLIDQWQALEHGHFGIDTSTVGLSGRLRDGSYVRDEQSWVDKRIEELGARADGFDAEVDPVTRKLILRSPGKGVDRSQGADSVVFDDRVITSAQTMFSVAPGDVASEAYGTATASGAETALWSAQSNLDVRGTFGRAAVAGTWSNGVSEQATLDDHVRALLDARDQALFVPSPGMRVTPDSDLSAYDVGDTVQIEMDSVMGVSGAFRIRKRTVAVAESGAESVDLEFV